MNVLNRQSVFDLAIEHCGTIEAALQLSLVNGLSVTEKLEIGSELINADVQNDKVVNYYKINIIHPATELTDLEINETIAQQGIEFWAIEVDFVIS